MLVLSRPNARFRSVVVHGSLQDGTFDRWRPKILEMIPSYGKKLSEDKIASVKPSAVRIC